MSLSMKSSPGISAYTLTRSGGSGLDAAAVQQRSRSFGAAVGRVHHATLLAMRDEHGLSTMMLTPDASSAANAAAEALAHSVGGTATKVDRVPDMSADALGVLVARPEILAGRETTAGADPAEVARTIERATVPGSWVAVTLRSPKGGELKRARRWFDHRQVPGTHYSREGEVMIGTFHAGGPDAGTVSSMLSQVVATLPGFDVETDVKVLSGSAAVLGTAGGAALLWGAFGPFGPQISQLAAYPQVEVGALGAAGLLALGSFGYASGVLSTAAARTKASLSTGSIPAPPVDHGVGKRAPRKEGKKPDGTIVPEHPGDYPLNSTSFLVGPSVVVGIAAPFGGGSAGAAVTRDRDASPALLARIGPAIGTAPSGLPVHISAADLSSSVGIMGIPDAGKASPLSQRVPVPVSKRFPSGWATIGELEVGDDVYAPDGSITEIVRTTAPYLGKTYDLVLSDSQVIGAHEGHLWTVAAKIDRRAHASRHDEKRSEIAMTNRVQAQRLRALAHATPAGTAITAREAQPFLGVNRHAVRKFARQSGIPASTAVAGTRTATCWPMGELLSSYADHMENLGDRAKAGRVRRPLFQTVTTDQMRRSLKTSDGANNWAISTCESLRSVTGMLDVPIEPYLLGAWLGDGNSWNGYISVGSQDLSEMLYLLGEHWPKIEHTTEPDGNTTVRLVRHGSCPLDFSFAAALAEVGLLRNKHIPALYQRASHDVRLAVLQGLMDTDGSIDSQGRCELSLSDERLATDALELIRSLGIKASKRINPASYRNDDGEIVECKDRHRITFTTTLPVFKMRRKAERIPAKVRESRDWLYVTDIRDAGEQMVKCITVDHPSSNFLIGDFVPTHNSVALRAIFGWHCLERVVPSGMPGFPGKRSTLISFENKGEGAAMYARWATGLGDDPVRIDLSDPRTAAIDFFDIPGSSREKALLFVNAMRYAFPDGSIEAQSMENLVAVVDAAQHITAEMSTQLLGRAHSVVECAHILLGGNGDDAGVALAVGLAEAREANPDDEDLVEAVMRLGPMYGGSGQTKVTPAQRRQIQSAPRNKMDALAEAKSWWDPQRPKVGWKRLLEDHECVIINTGVADDGSLVSDRLTQLMSSMMMFTLRESVMRNCSGWKDMGKAVTIFADELALLSGGSGEVINWFRNQGRSYGIRQVLATQFPDQLQPEVRASVLGFGTFYWFTQTNAQIAQLAVDDLTADGSEWTRADITGLKKHTAIVRATVDKQRQPATTVRIGYWEGEGGLKVFCPDQGYPDTTDKAYPPTERGWMGKRPAPAKLYADVIPDIVKPEPAARVSAVDDDPFDAETDVATPAPPTDDDLFDPRRFDLGGDDFGTPIRRGDAFGNPPRRK